MKRLLNALVKRGYNATFVVGEEYDYIRIDDVIEDDYIEISKVRDEVLLVVENAFINVDSLKIDDIEEGIKRIK